MNVLDLDRVRAAARAPFLTGRISSGKVILSLNVPAGDGQADAHERFSAASREAAALGFRAAAAPPGWRAAFEFGSVLLRLRFAPGRPTR